MQKPPGNAVLPAVPQSCPSFVREGPTPTTYRIQWDMPEGSGAMAVAPCRVSWRMRSLHMYVLNHLTGGIFSSRAGLKRSVEKESFSLKCYRDFPWKSPSISVIHCPMATVCVSCVTYRPGPHISPSCCHALNPLLILCPPTLLGVIFPLPNMAEESSL